MYCTEAEVDGETVDSAATDDVDVVDVAEGARDCSVELEEAVDVGSKEEAVDDVTFSLGPAVNEETSVDVVEVDVGEAELVDGREEEATEVDVTSSREVVVTAVEVGVTDDCEEDEDDGAEDVVDVDDAAEDVLPESPSSKPLRSSSKAGARFPYPPDPLRARCLR